MMMAKSQTFILRRGYPLSSKGPPYSFSCYVRPFSRTIKLLYNMFRVRPGSWRRIMSHVTRCRISADSRREVRSQQ